MHQLYVVVFIFIIKILNRNVWQFFSNPISVFSGVSQETTFSTTIFTIHKRHLYIFKYLNINLFTDDVKIINVFFLLRRFNTTIRLGINLDLMHGQRPEPNITECSIIDYKLLNCKIQRVKSINDLGYIFWYKN